MEDKGAAGSHPGFSGHFLLAIAWVDDVPFCTNNPTWGKTGSSGRTAFRHRENTHKHGRPNDWYETVVLVKDSEKSPTQEDTVGCGDCSSPTSAHWRTLDGAWHLHVAGSNYMNVVCIPIH